MGKHEAPPAPARAKLTGFGRFLGHKATHITSLVALHFLALGVIGLVSPLLAPAGIGSVH